jgi:thiazole synthase
MVNGERRETAAGPTLGELLRELELDPQLIVVERNREILRDRTRYDEIALADGDALELVHFVGGG